MHALIRDLESRIRLLPFHRQWLASAYDPDIQVAALSCPRGNAKTWLIGNLAAQAITPGSPTFNSAVEVLGVSASLEQSRIMLSFCREAIGDREDDYRWLDSGQRLAVTHKATGTKFRILSSSGKRAMGLANFSTIYADEPGSWEERGGKLMWDALRTSLGKQPGQRLLLIGTRSPASPDSWWPQLLDAGSGLGTHVTILSAPDDKPWDAWDTIRKVNPMAVYSGSLRKTILRERDDARRNETMRPAFEAYRLNRQVDVRNAVLVTVDAWKRVEARPVPPRVGRPLVGIDVGSSRSWSAAWCLWENGRSEAYALCPGVPGLSEREHQDAMPRGVYQQLANAGVLLIDEGRRMARVQVLIDHLYTTLGIKPATIYCDLFLIDQLRDAVRGRSPIVVRRTRWSEATEDISSFRRMAADGPMSIHEPCRKLIKVSLSSAEVRSEEGNCRLVKHDKSRSRDDVAVAGVIASGGWDRCTRKQNRPPFRWVVTG